MPYKDAEEAAALAKRGKGSLVGSIVSHDENFAETSWKMASQHGRIFVLNRDNAKESRSRFTSNINARRLVEQEEGEEMGGLSGLHFSYRKQLFRDLRMF
jgi:oxepin-CoA hydrolase/3-oxo-5,6-dehydrosuberyl-CoA semialdehyde dehydrogenase